MWLSSKLGLPYFVVAQFPLDELRLQLAYHRLSDDGYSEQLFKEMERERIKNLTPTEQAREALRQMGFRLPETER